jgi:hypothetical protein
VESVTILRELWRRRLLVVVVAIFAIAAGWLLAFEPTFPLKSRGYDVGLASARVLVDTPQSQVVEVAPEGSETLGSRASVLANLMIDGELKAQIERRAGLRPNQLIATSEAVGGVDGTVPLTRNSYVLTTGVVVNSDLAQLPLLKVETQAPDPAKAAKLGDAAVAGLTAYLESKASSQRIPTERRLNVNGLGPAQAHLARRGPGPVMGAAAALFVFLAGCAAILALSSLIRAWRVAAATDRDEKKRGRAPNGFLDEERSSGADTLARKPSKAGVRL